MEVEAKFHIPDGQTFQRLLETANLSGFHLGEVSVAKLHDRYLDTAGGAVRAAGYACRIRCQASHCVATLKGLGGTSNGIHRRQEYEVTLPEPSPPRDWPPSPARDLALRLGGDEPLIPLFEFEQIRHSRTLYAGDRAVAEFSLDRVTVYHRDGIADAYLELEAELLPQGTEKDLGELAAELQSRGLTPQNRSKYERALALFHLETIPAQEAEWA